MQPKRKGAKWFGKDGDYMDGGVGWALFGPEVTDLEIYDQHPAYYGGVGREFAHKAIVRRVNSRTLVTQVFGLDV